MSQQVPSYSPKKLDFTNFQILEAPSMSTAPLACSLCFQFRNSLLGRTGSYEYRRDVCFIKDGYVGKLSGRGKTRKPSEPKRFLSETVCLAIFVYAFFTRGTTKTLWYVAFVHVCPIDP